jgi:hypothetical protein
MAERAVRRSMLGLNGEHGLPERASLVGFGCAAFCLGGSRDQCREVRLALRSADVREREHRAGQHGCETKRKRCPATLLLQRRAAEPMVLTSI